MSSLKKLSYKGALSTVFSSNLGTRDQAYAFPLEFSSISTKLFGLNIRELNSRRMMNVNYTDL